jgi:aspartyl-tRNA(Asn)/glutamyl-tRNA(Gln) amidotransferase subunit A
MARSVADLVLAYDVMQGRDTEDPAQAPRAVEKLGGVVAQGVAGLRIAIAAGYFHGGATRNCLEAVQEAATALGATSVIELPDPALARSAAYMITASEGAALHIPRLRQDAAGFDPDTRDRFLAGALMPAAFVQQAQKLRRRFAAQMAEVFAEWDVLLAPATPVSAPLIGQKDMQLGAATVPVRANLGIYTQPFSFIGLPVVLAPICRAGALPVGVQIIAAPWHEDQALRVVAALERLGVVGPARPG